MLLRRANRSRHRKLPCRPASRHLRLESLESRLLLTGLPYGAHSQDTGEYMLGEVVVTVVLFESNGTIQPSTEDWNELVRDESGNPVLDNLGRTISVSGANRIEETKDNVREGLGWWEQTLANFGSWLGEPVPTPVHSLNFIYDFEFTHNPVDTAYEPIAGPSTNFAYWVEEFLAEAGYATSASRDIDIREFNNSQRLKYDADWAFTIFVANDENDLDGKFAPGGFQYAFAYSGGRFFVAPAGRPAASFTHETAHMFWARDEYQYSGASYLDERGYYNTQNWNAWDNPHLDVREDSLMDGGTSFGAAYDSHVSSESSLAMVGWLDSDGDGVFDVLDIPLTLSGTGHYDLANGNYRFFGHSAVQTLINQNSSGLQNDITINEVSLAEYSLDGGMNWQVADNYGSYQADLDLTIPMAPGQEILIRTRSVDSGTGKTVATSQTLFFGNTQLPTSVLNAGIHGFAWHDADANGIWDAQEPGIPGWTMQLVDAQGQALGLRQTLEPDDYAEYELVNNVLAGVTLRAIGYGVSDERVAALQATTSSTGQNVLGFVSWGTSDDWSSDWTTDSRQLRIDFANPVTTLSIDAVARNSDAYGRLEIYAADDVLLDRYTTGLLQGDAVETMSLNRPTAEISYAIVRSHMNSKVRLDNLRVGPESSAVTDSLGAFHIPNLPAGTHYVQAIPTGPWEVTQPQTAIQEIVVLADGSMSPESETGRAGDFRGELTSPEYPWQNPIDSLDVDDNGVVTPLDALLIINELNRNGAHELSILDGGTAPPPFLDVNGDNLVTPHDALLIINVLNRQSGGKGEPANGNLPNNDPPNDDPPNGDPPNGDKSGPEGEMPETDRQPLAGHDRPSRMALTGQVNHRPEHDFAAYIPLLQTSQQGDRQDSKSRTAADLNESDQAVSPLQRPHSIELIPSAKSVDWLFRHAVQLSATDSWAESADDLALDDVLGQLARDLTDPTGLDS